MTDDNIRARSSAPEAREIAYQDAHNTAVELGYPSLTEALEDLDRLKEAREGEAVAEIEPLFWAWLKERDLCPDGDVVEWQDIIVALDEHEIEIMAAPSADKLRDVLIDLTSWFTKPVQGQNGMVWVIRAGERGADDALNAALAALKAEV